MNYKQEVNMNDLNSVFRILALAVMFMMVLVKDIPYVRFFKNSMIQLYLAISAILILILLDNVTGFILALSLLVLYFKIYNTELKHKKNTDDLSSVKKENENRCVLDKKGDCVTEAYENHLKNDQMSSTNHVTLLPYVSEEHLLAAQNNIIDVNNYNNEILGIEKGLYNENVYGSQGFDNNNVHMRGFDNNLLGSLKYGVIE
jgi:hypothetical protein